MPCALTVCNPSRWVLVIYTGGWPSNQPPKVARIVSCGTDAEYFTIHAPDRRKGEKAHLVERAEFSMPQQPNLDEHGGIVWRIQKTVEERLAQGA